MPLSAALGLMLCIVWGIIENPALLVLVVLLVLVLGPVLRPIYVYFSKYSHHNSREFGGIFYRAYLHFLQRKVMVVLWILFHEYADASSPSP